jgi:hypothetical protein
VTFSGKKTAGVAKDLEMGNILAYLSGCDIPSILQEWQRASEVKALMTGAEAGAMHLEDQGRSDGPQAGGLQKQEEGEEDFPWFGKVSFLTQKGGPG